MEPIINPSLFYLLDFLGDFEFVCGLVVVLLIIAVVIRYLLYYLVDCDDCFDDEKPPFPKFIKISTWITTICLIITIFIPSKETVYTMLLAKQVTPNNVTQVQTVIKDTADYIVDAIKYIKGETNE